MKPIIDRLTRLLEQVQGAISQLHLDSEQKVLDELEARMLAPDFWSDQGEAQKISQEVAMLRKFIDSWRVMEDSIKTMLELAQISDESLLDALTKSTDEIEDSVRQMMITVKLAGDYDKNTAIVQISAGVGGTDAQDWAEMLLTMYSRAAEKLDLVASLVDISRGEEAGIKSATLEITGPFAFGKLKSEKGVHRLVRLSPFNSDSLRQTSFALVDVVPEIPMEGIDLDEKDLRIDVYRAGGHGGQSVNTTDSAVRVTHLPTGIVVSIQNERSQLKNKAKALSILGAKLAELAREQHLESIAELRGKVQSADWGQQIRSYVLHPYKKVKDHRTGYETSDTEAVLAGEIEPFIEAYLLKTLDKKS
ncbi:peptide chain release factor 2 [bacterium]|nr:MAG: peptide chain release factor 2 [bacterium]